MKIFILVIVGGINNDEHFYCSLSYIKVYFVYLATGSDPSGGFVAAGGSSGPPGGVGNRARRLGRI